DPLGSTEEFSR
nr:RecName: Full=Unknown protein 2 [Ephedra distachya]